MTFACKCASPMWPFMVVSKTCKQMWIGQYLNLSISKKYYPIPISGRYLNKRLLEAAVSPIPLLKSILELISLSYLECCLESHPLATYMDHSLSIVTAQNCWTWFQGGPPKYIPIWILTSLVHPQLDKHFW